MVDLETSVDVLYHFCTHYVQGDVYLHDIRYVDGAIEQVQEITYHVSVILANTAVFSPILPYDKADLQRLVDGMIVMAHICVTRRHKLTAREKYQVGVMMQTLGIYKIFLQEARDGESP